MAVNFPGPYQVRLFYTTSVNAIPLQHVQQLNLGLSTTPAPGDGFDTVFPMLRGGVSSDDLETLTNTWAVGMQNLFSNVAGNTIDYAELWKYDAGTFDASFISTLAINLPGTRAAATAQSNQQMMVFRSTNGGVVKFNFMETVLGTGAKDTTPFSDGTAESIRDDIEGGIFPWIGRDNGWPFATIGLYPGQNEAIFKKRFR